MKDKLFISLILAILALAAGVLFWYGERVIHLRASTGYSVVAFESTSNSISLNELDEKEYEVLIFSIHNLENDAKIYSIGFFINGAEIDSLKHEVGPDPVFFGPTKKVKEGLNEYKGDNQLEYKVIVQWDEQEEIIYKNINFNEK